MTTSLSAVLARNVALNPDAPAATYLNQSWTWRNLDQLSRALAVRLGVAGIEPQDRVVLLARNGPACLVTLFGAAQIRAVYTPLNWRLTIREVADLLDDLDPLVIIVDPELAGLVTTWLSRSTHRCQVIGTDQILATNQIAADEQLHNEATDLMTAEADDLAFQLYTSGTTGMPKGAMFANGTSLHTLVTDISSAWGFDKNDVSLAAMPLFHMGGLAWLIAGMARGVRTVIVPTFDPSNVLDVCEANDVTTALFVPAMLGALLEVPDLTSRRLTIRRLFYSGAPMSSPALRAALDAFACDFVQIYGLTEATGAFAQLEPDDHDPHGPRSHLLGSAGRPYPWVEVNVVDPVSGAVLTSGASGEIWTRSAQNFVGYHAAPESSAEVLTADGWLRTGDIGFIDDDGYLFLRDRRKDVIITGGENVYPVEVEKVLSTLPEIAETAVIGVPSDRWGETVKAIVVPRRHYVVDPGQVINHCRSQLAGFKCPTSVAIVDQLPRTATGKVRKDVLREPYWRGHERRIN